MNKVGTTLAIGAWLGLIVVAFQPLLAYQSKAGKEAAAVEMWPKDSALPRTADGATVIMFMHPQCPCSTASLNELDHVSAKVGSSFRAVVVIEQPHYMDAAWSNSAHAKHSARLRGVTTVFDRGQLEASRFGATTSGDTFVYASDGHLLFHGGITPGRGHEGDCAGADTVISLLRGRAAEVRATPSFGCGLFNH
jgi:hypothetical protein